MTYNVAFLLQQQPASPFDPRFMFVLVAMAGIMYFLVIRPQQQQRKRLNEMLANLESGNEVLTTGGIVGTIVSISGDTLILRVKPDNIKLQVARSAVSGLVKQQEIKPTVVEKK
jgi:preprotein translocase subunit YajC